LVAIVAVLALAGCTSAASQRTAPTDQAVAPASDSGGAVRAKSPVAEIDVCTAITPESLEQVLGVRFEPGVPGTPGGTLLGECDYVPAAPDASLSSSAQTSSAQSLPPPAAGVSSGDGAAASSTTPGAPADSVAHVYIAARSASQYARMVNFYQLTPTTVAGQRGAFGPKTGLLMHVPFGDYVLQIAVAEVGGALLQTPAEVIAMRYITS
jgi:hypothetical protein